MSVCKAGLWIKGQQACGYDLESPHTGLAHHNKAQNAYWCSDGEAKRAQRTINARERVRA